MIDRDRRRRRVRGTDSDSLAPTSYIQPRVSDSAFGFRLKPEGKREAMAYAAPMRRRTCMICMHESKHLHTYVRFLSVLVSTRRGQRTLTLPPTS